MLIFVHIWGKVHVYEMHMNSDCWHVALQQEAFGEARLSAERFKPTEPWISSERCEKRSRINVKQQKSHPNYERRLLYSALMLPKENTKNHSDQQTLLLFFFSIKRSFLADIIDISSAYSLQWNVTTKADWKKKNNNSRTSFSYDQMMKYVYVFLSQAKHSSVMLAHDNDRCSSFLLIFWASIRLPIWLSGPLMKKELCCFLINIRSMLFTKTESIFSFDVFVQLFVFWKQYEEVSD